MNEKTNFNNHIQFHIRVVLKDVKSISFKNKKRLLVINKLADNIFKIIVMNPNTNFLENQNLIMEVEGLKKGIPKNCIILMIN